MTNENGEIPEWQQPGMLAGLEVCLTCFGLRGEFKGREHRCACVPFDDEWRDRHWEGYDIAAHVDLCHLCVRDTMKSGSRYAWYVCDQCLQVNRTAGAVFGSKRAGALPVRRHSLMNRVTLSTSQLDEADVRFFKDGLLGLISIWRRLSNWRTAEATRLYGSLGRGGAAVSLNYWLAGFPSSTGASVDAFCRFVEYDLPQHPDLKGLRTERERFLEAQTSRVDHFDQAE